MRAHLRREGAGGARRISSIAGQARGNNSARNGGKAIDARRGIRRVSAARSSRRRADGISREQHQHRLGAKSAACCLRSNSENNMLATWQRLATGRIARYKRRRRR